MQASKTKIARQIDCKITTGLFTMREALTQPATLHLPPVAMDAVNARLAALEAIQKQARLVILDPINNELPPESVPDVAKLVTDAKKAVNVLVNLMAQMARINQD